MTEYKGLIISIFRTNRFGDSSNGGISATANEALVIGQGIPEIFSNLSLPPSLCAELPVFRLELNRGGKKSVRLVPVVLDGKWTMFGGNFGHTSDGRFSDAIRAILGHDFYGAVAIHDRVE